MLSNVCRTMIGAFLMLVLVTLAAGQSVGSPSGQAATGATPTLNYEFFKTHVEPIFLKRRPGHARCYACHGSGTGPQYLVPLTPGSAFWTEDQSRQNFRNVSALVDVTEPMTSTFLIHPLSPLAGGDFRFAHSGGRQFESKDDPDWQTMARWVRGEAQAGSNGQ